MPPVLSTATVRSRVKEIDSGEYRLISEYEKATGPIRLLHLPCGQVIETKAKGFLQEGKGRCKTCRPPPKGRSRGSAAIPESEVLQRIADQLGDEYQYVSGYTSMSGKCRMLHLPCGHEWEVSPTMMLGTKRSRCPQCSNLRRGSHLRSPTYLLDVLASQPWGPEYEWLEDYGNDNKAQLAIRHLSCSREYKVRPNDFQQGYRCPHCSRDAADSYNVTKIVTVLQRLGIPFEREVSYPDCRLKIALRFDFRLILEGGDHVLIEYDGEQHFRASGYITEQALTTNRERDRVKNKYCAERPHLHLHRIDYGMDVEKQLQLILTHHFLLM